MRRFLMIFILLIVGCGKNPDKSVSALNIQIAMDSIAYARSQDIAIDPFAEKQLLIVISNNLQTAEDRGYQTCKSED